MFLMIFYVLAFGGTKYFKEDVFYDEQPLTVACASSVILAEQYIATVRLSELPSIIMQQNKETDHWVITSMYQSEYGTVYTHHRRGGDLTDVYKTLVIGGETDFSVINASLNHLVKCYLAVKNALSSRQTLADTIAAVSPYNDAPRSARPQFAAIPTEQKLDLTSWLKIPIQFIEQSLADRDFTLTHENIRKIFDGAKKRAIEVKSACFTRNFWMQTPQVGDTYCTKVSTCLYGQDCDGVFGDTVQIVGRGLTSWIVSVVLNDDRVALRLSSGENDVIGILLSQQLKGMMDFVPRFFGIAKTPDGRMASLMELLSGDLNNAKTRGIQIGDVTVFEYSLGVFLACWYIGISIEDRKPGNTGLRDARYPRCYHLGNDVYYFPDESYAQAVLIDLDEWDLPSLEFTRGKYKKHPYGGLSTGKISTIFRGTAMHSSVVKNFLADLRQVDLQPVPVSLKKHFFHYRVDAQVFKFPSNTKHYIIPAEIIDSALEEHKQSITMNDKTSL